MCSDRLQRISFVFPAHAGDFYAHLVGLLDRVPGARLMDGELVLFPGIPDGALPTTSFVTGDCAFPYMTFDQQDSFRYELGCFTMCTTDNAHLPNQTTSSTRHDYTVNQDSLGTYVSIGAGKNVRHLLPIQELYARMHSHVVRLDHTGVNIPTELIAADEWRKLVNSLSHTSNMYRYPTGTDWPFILPATAEEYAADIVDFVGGREPKFELALDTYTSVPTLQIDMQVDMTRTEVERLLPAPYGMSFGDLGDTFRTVYVHHAWEGLSIRFDVRFISDHDTAAWDSGRWLVRAGGRLR